VREHYLAGGHCFGTLPGPDGGKVGYWEYNVCVGGSDRGVHLGRPASPNVLDHSLH